MNNDLNKISISAQPTNLPKSPQQCNEQQQFFDITEYVTTEGAAKFLARLLGKNFTPNAIRLRVYRGQLTPIKPFGEQGGSYFRISELRQRFTRSQKKGK